MNIKASAALGTLALATLTAVDVILFNKISLTPYKFQYTHSLFTCSRSHSKPKRDKMETYATVVSSPAPRV